MKYTAEVEIDLPRQRVVELFDNPDNMHKWQPELQNFEHLSGEPGQPGARSKLTYKMGKRKVEMTETVTRRNLPDHFDGTYEASGVYNIQKNRFVESGEGKTLWISESEFRFSGFMKVMALFMKGAFKKQTQKFMQQFKEFAENGN